MLLSVGRHTLLQQLRRKNFWNRFSDSLMDKIHEYATHRPHALTIQKISDFSSHADVEESYEFLRTEIPSRLAGMIKEMGSLPDDIMSIRTIETVGCLYCSTLKQILQFENVDDHSKANLDNFYKVLDHILTVLHNVPYTMANGMMTYKQRFGPLSHHKTEVIQTFMDRFLLNRISTRVIMRQHTEAYIRLTKESDRLPYIETDCPLKEITTDAYEDAKLLCEESYRYNAPKLKLEEYNTIDPDKNVTITYPRSHLHLISFEIIKNALRAVIEYSEKVCKQRLGIPTDRETLAGEEVQKLAGMTQDEIWTRPLLIKLIKSHEDITMTITDLGGGIPHTISKCLFQYLYTTAKVNLLSDDVHMDTGITPMAGYGCGLPISRLYARYFTGDIKIASIEGRGTTAYIYLKALPTEARENLPIYTSATEKIYGGHNVADQWTGDR